MVMRMARNVFWLLVTVTIVVLAFGYRTSREHDEGAAPASQVSTEPSASASSSAAAAGKTYLGKKVDTGYGILQVKITVAGKKVTAADVPVYPTDNDTSSQINHHAVPILTKETVKAQSAKVDMVSGATHTSKGYRTSLQSALDRAGL